jgi:hypothetical protein
LCLNLLCEPLVSEVSDVLSIRRTECGIERRTGTIVLLVTDVTNVIVLLLVWPDRVRGAVFGVVVDDQRLIIIVRLAEYAVDPPLDEIRSFVHLDDCCDGWVPYHNFF